MPIKTRKVWEYGDFQTPLGLSERICQLLVSTGVTPATILEPTCGQGSFLCAAADAFPESGLIGVEINPEHLQVARTALNAECVSGRQVDLYEGNFFDFPWGELLKDLSGSLLILGNPPWVTSAELGALASSNLPVKRNVHNHRGIDSITGKSNFDISEWMLLRYLDWLEERGGYIAVLVKTVVARKILHQAWKSAYPIKGAKIYPIDAMRHFGASVDACLFLAHVEPGATSISCDVFEDFQVHQPSHKIGFEDGRLIGNMDDYLKWRHLAGVDQHYVWRSGIKHDCSSIMELVAVDGHFRNGLGEEIMLEEDFVYPMLKSSDVNRDQARRDRYMLVPQRMTGEETRHIHHSAPLTWEYLQRHAAILGRRGSSIYRNRPPFSVFGVGDYSFAPWKVAISGFYKKLRFVPVGPLASRPTVLDDTVYFLPCQSEAEALFISQLLNSNMVQEFYSAMIFWTDKRPITSEVLRRLDLARAALELGRVNEYEYFHRQRGIASSRQLAMFDSPAS